MIKPHEVSDFAIDLVAGINKFSSAKKINRFGICHVDSAFINNALVFFFELNKNVAVFVRYSVGAKAQFFFENRTFKRISDKAVGRRVKIKVANRAFAVFIGKNIFADEGKKLFFLGACDNILFFVSFEYRPEG